jgi:hypothetical protein
MKKHGSKIAIVAAFIAWGFIVSYASSDFMSTFNNTYPTSSMSGNCSVCHTSIPSLNPYGADFQKNGHSLSAVENLDSDSEVKANP